MAKKYTLVLREFGKNKRYENLTEKQWTKLRALARTQEGVMVVLSEEHKVPDEDEEGQEGRLGRRARK